MPRQVWFIKNVSREGPGLLAPLLDSAGIPHRTVDLDREAFPAPSAGDALVILGGPDSANDRTGKIAAELEAIGACLARGVPVLGICLGLQLLVAARGGRVFRSPVKEVGFKGPDGTWFDLRLTPEGVRDPLLAGLPDAPRRIFQLHGEAVDLAAGMTCLAEGAFCRHQIAKVQEKAYGIQGHLELSEEMLEEWLRQDGDLQQVDASSVRRDYQDVRGELESTCRIVFRNFLRLADGEV